MRESRSSGALVFLPSEDEWYKSAYYKSGGTNAGYWDYPTQSDTVPTAEVPPGTDLTNGSANYNKAVGNLTDVGAYMYKPSDSAYGTFDQGANVWEWNEEDIYGDASARCIRGGAFTGTGDKLAASYRYLYGSSGETYNVSFRVAGVPEPASIVLLLAFGILGVLRRRRT